MSYSKISSITLYVVAAISLVVILFFYVSPKTIDFDVDDRVDQIMAGTFSEDGEEAAPSVEETPAGDTTEVDSSELEEAGTAMEDENLMAEEGSEIDEDSTQMASMAGADTETPEAVPTEIDLKDYLSGWEIMVHKRTDYALGWAYVLLLIAAIAAVLFPLITVVTDVKAIIRLLSVLAGAAVLLLLSYFVFASDSPIDILGYTGTDNTNPVALKWIGTGLFSTYIIFGVALVSILYSEIANLFK